MLLYKRIEIDLDKERKRIRTVKYNKRQRAALFKLCDLFEAGEWQECLHHVHDKRAFPYNVRGEYDEKEHINVEITNVLRTLYYEVFYTRDQVLEAAKEILTRTEIPAKK